MNSENTHVTGAAAIGWAAGFVDGEGCIHLSKTRQPGRRYPTYRPRLDLSQNNREVLVRLREILDEDAGLYLAKRQPSENRQSYKLGFDGVHALRAVAKLRPHLIRKDVEADVLLSYPALGWMGVHPGPKGYPPEVWVAREQSEATEAQVKSDRRRPDMGANGRSGAAERELDRYTSDLLRRCTIGISTEPLLPRLGDEASVDLFELQALDEAIKRAHLLPRESRDSRLGYLKRAMALGPRRRLARALSQAAIDDAVEVPELWRAARLRCSRLGAVQSVHDDGRQPA